VTAILHEYYNYITFSKKTIQKNKYMIKFKTYMGQVLCLPKNKEERKRKNMRKTKGQKGITLIALIITIIVMMVLVGVTVTIVLNSDILGLAQRAGRDTRAKYDEERTLGRVCIDGIWYDSMADYIAERPSAIQDGESDTGIFDIIEDSETKVAYLRGIKPTYKVEDENYYYSIVENGKGITELVIPSESPNGYPITEIWTEAFARCKNLTKVIIPNTVTTIGRSAFYRCGSLAQVVMPNSVKRINDSAFSRCVALTNVELPDNLEYIGYGVFYDCIGIESFDFPATLSPNYDEAEEDYRDASWDYAFYNTAWWNNLPNGEIYINNYEYASKSGEEVDSPKLNGSGYMYIASMAETTIDGVTWLYKEVTNGTQGWIDLYGCKVNSFEQVHDGSYTTNVYLPETISFPGTIGQKQVRNIFWDVDETGFREEGDVYLDIKKPASQIIVNGNVEALKIVDSGYRMAYEYGSFSDREGSYRSVPIKAESWVLPDTIKVLDFPNLFNGATAITMPSSLEYIGVRTFAGSQVANLNIPTSVSYVGRDAFKDSLWYNSKSDGDIYINNTYYKYKGDVPENGVINIRQGTTTILEEAFKDQTNLIGVVLPEGLVSIGYRAFYNCTSLTSVTLPEGLKTVGDRAFYGCTGLTSINQPDSLTYIGYQAFKFNPSYGGYGY